MPKFIKPALGVIITCLISSISIAQSNRGYAQLWYNGKKLHKLIVDRIPDYGINDEDGCVVERAIRLEFRDIDSLTVQGLLRDAETKDPLPGAVIKLERLGQEIEILNPDAKGRFIVKKASPVRKITVQYIGYRTLKIEGIPKKFF